MRLSDITVEVRDKTLKRWGMIDPDLLVLEGTVRHCGVGSWKLTLPADHELVPLLRTPGSGIIVTGPRDVLWSGPTTNPALAISADDPHGTVTITGETDDAILADALAWPTPGAAIGAQGGHDTRTGPAETVMLAYVNANVGPGGALTRRGLLAQKLTLAPDLGRGITVAKSARFPVLADLLTEIATVAGLGWRVVQRGEVLVFEVYQIADRSRFVRFDIANGSLSSQSVEQSPPEQTHVIVGGQNDLADRTLVERTTPASLAGMIEWGRRRERFRDQRQTDDLLELQQAGDEILAESGFTATAVKALPSDDQTMLYGVDWHEGDRVTVVVDGQETTSTVTAVSLSVGKSGVRVGADIGDTSGFDPTSSISRRVTDTETRVSQLERTAEAGSTTMTGEIRMWPGPAAPAGWLLCRGQVVLRAAYPDLFAVIGTAFAGAATVGAAEFRLPALQTRVPIGADPAYPLGTYGGAYTHTLTEAQMPSHTHTQTAHNHATFANIQHVDGTATVGEALTSGLTAGGRRRYYDTTEATTAVNHYAGGSQPFPIMQPWTAVNFIIKT